MFFECHYIQSYLKMTDDTAFCAKNTVKARGLRTTLLSYAREKGSFRMVYYFCCIVFSLLLAIPLLANRKWSVLITLSVAAFVSIQLVKGRGISSILFCLHFHPHVKANTSHPFLTHARAAITVPCKMCMPVTMLSLPTPFDKNNNIEQNVVSYNGNQ